jgi:hypothetical protein
VDSEAFSGPVEFSPPSDAVRTTSVAVDRQLHEAVDQLAVRDA